MELKTSGYVFCAAWLQQVKGVSECDKDRRSLTQLESGQRSEVGVRSADFATDVVQSCDEVDEVINHSGDAQPWEQKETRPQRDKK